MEIFKYCRPQPWKSSAQFPRTTVSFLLFPAAIVTKKKRSFPRDGMGGMFVPHDYTLFVSPTFITVITLSPLSSIKVWDLSIPENRPVRSIAGNNPQVSTPILHANGILFNPPQATLAQSTPRHARRTTPSCWLLHRRTVTPVYGTYVSRQTTVSCTVSTPRKHAQPLLLTPQTRVNLSSVIYTYRLK